MPEPNADSGNSRGDVVVFTPDASSRRTIYFLFGGLSLASLVVGIWTLAHVVTGQADCAQPIVLFTLCTLVLLLGVHGLSVRIEVSDSEINYRSFFGSKRFLIADIASILPVSARGFAGIKISTSNGAMVVHGYSLSKELLSKLTETITQRSGNTIVTNGRHGSLMSKQSFWLTLITYSPYIILFGGAFLALIIYHTRH